MDTPAGDELAQCRVEAEKIGQATGWTVKDGRGFVLRRFLDTNGDNKVDSWCYFQGGLEVYRDIDSNGNGKVDQSRWLNTGGSRWGLDANEDGVIDQWRQISAEEVAEEAVAALLTQDLPRFRVLQATPAEVNALELGPTYSREIVELLKNAESRFAENAAKVPAVGTLKWIQFAGHRPGVVPAGTLGLTRDILVYDNAVAFAESQQGTIQVFLGAMIQVGNAWRLVDAPFILDENAADSLAGGLFFRPPTPATPTSPGENAPTEEMQKLLAELETVEKALAEAKSLDEQTDLNGKRADLLRALAAAAVRPEDRVTWLKQLADTLSATAQGGTFPEGAARLKALYDEIAKDPAQQSLAAYVRFRQLAAEYGLSLQAPDADYNKVLTGWIANLEQFLKDFPDAPDAAEAIMQIAVGKEYLGDEEGAQRQYQLLATRFPETPEGVRARGALKRLTMEGQVLDFKGKDPQGGTVDVAAYRGKAVVIQYWASWCEPCKAEMAILKDLLSRYGSQLAVVGVNVDTDAADMTAYLRDAKLPWPQIREEGGMESRPALELGILTVPTTILLDGQGRVVDRNVVATELEAKLKQIIR
ncbi:MAG: redoxin domain-containing protein, partial [Thermogutta sp.]|nr:redoxin domain-containing protein [Thermogutta sp.]